MSSTGERVVAGRYRLRRRLGQGAMGTVWEAFDEFLLRTVAVKEVLLPPGLPDEQAAELRERTLREARAIAALSHPNVITLHDVAREDGEPFVVTEYVLAYSLATLVEVLGPLPETKAAAITNAVAAGLSAAHQVGITHRDVKPGNVLIGVDGQVKLTDFGIARNVAEHTLTSTGIMLGSPAYIAPEVAAGREVTPAADLWGLGATLFAVLEGRPPYDVSGAVLATVNQVVNGEVPTVSTDGPLAELVAALMVKDPVGRISLREVRNRLHPLLPPPSTPLLTDEDLALLAAAEDEQGTSSAVGTDGDPDGGADGDPDGGAAAPPLAADPGPLPSASGGAPLAAEPGAVPSPAAAGSLAPAPGPLPFEKSTVREPVRAERGAIAAGLVAFLAVLLFFAAAAGGFALSRRVGGEAVLPPVRSHGPTTSVTPSDDQRDTLTPRTGNAATISGLSSGEFTVPVPDDWVEFVEEVVDEELANSTIMYFTSPTGTELLTVERLPGYYPKHRIQDYLDRLGSQDPEVVVDIVFKQEIAGLTSGVASPEPAVEVDYRATTVAEAVAPDDPAALDMNRTTFAHLLPYAGDLWVVSVTVPIEQESAGNELFDRIVREFQVIG